MSLIPGSTNFWCQLDTASRERVVALFAADGWSVRKCSRTDFEVRCGWAELVVEAESPVLLHGPVADVATNAERLLTLLGRSGLAFLAEAGVPDGEPLGGREVPRSP